ncbi:MAG: hypothetical protein J6X55_02370 [Victivallales bacterium]|nr:hypothetical protein [Victivallales bacterium]
MEPPSCPASARPSAESPEPSRACFQAHSEAQPWDGPSTAESSRRTAATTADTSSQPDTTIHR